MSPEGGAAQQRRGGGAPCQSLKFSSFCLEIWQGQINGGQQHAGLESSHLCGNIRNQSTARGSSAMVAAGGYPDGERVSVWYGNLFAGIQ